MKFFKPNDPFVNGMIEEWNMLPYNQLLDKLTIYHDNKNQKVCFAHFGDLSKTIKIGGTSHNFKEVISCQLMFGIGSYKFASESGKMTLLTDKNIDNAAKMIVMILKIKFKSNKSVYIPNKYLELHAKANERQLIRHFGVSSTYKRAAVSSWTAFDLSTLVDLFYIQSNELSIDSSIHLLGLSGTKKTKKEKLKDEWKKKEDGMAMNHIFTSPQKIRSYDVPPADLELFKSNIEFTKEVNVLLGVTFGHYVVNNFNVTPIILADFGEFRITEQLTVTEKTNTLPRIFHGNIEFTEFQMSTDGLFPCPLPPIC